MQSELCGNVVCYAVTTELLLLVSMTFLLTIPKSAVTLFSYVYSRLTSAALLSSIHPKKPIHRPLIVPRCRRVATFVEVH